MRGSGDGQGGEGERQVFHKPLHRGASPGAPLIPVVMESPCPNWPKSKSPAANSCRCSD